MKARLLSLLAVAALVLTLAGCDDKKESGIKIAVINSERVIAESAAGKAGTTRMNDVSAALQTQLVALRAEYDADPKNEELAKKFQQGFAELQQRFAEQQALVNARINEAYQKALQNFRLKHGVDIVLAAESVLDSGPRADMTAELIAEFDKCEVSFDEQPPAGAAAPVQGETVNEPAPDASATPPADGQTPAKEGAK